MSAPTCDTWQRLAEMDINREESRCPCKILFTRAGIDDSHLMRNYRKYSDEEASSDEEFPITDKDAMQIVHSMGFKFESEVSVSESKISRADIIVNSRHGGSLRMSIKRKKFQEFSMENKKYWINRHRLFSKFDSGIKLDQESWFSVTPELLAKHIASRLKCRTIVDAFCGAGGNSIQFAMVCDRVIAIDIDPKKIRMARHNARIYGVEDKIVFINKDFFEFVSDSRSRADAVFLSPPWGGPSYRNKETFSLKDVTPDMDKIMAKARSLSNNIAAFLPRNTAVEELMEFSEGKAFEVEQNVLCGRLKTVTVYYGNLVDTVSDPIARVKKEVCSPRPRMRIEPIEQSWRTDRKDELPSWDVERSLEEKLSSKPLAYRSFNNRAGRRDSPKETEEVWDAPKRSQYFEARTLEEKLSAPPTQFKNFSTNKSKRSGHWNFNTRG